QKVGATFDYNRKSEPHFAVDATRTYAEQALQSQKVYTHVVQGTWSSPKTSRLLFDAGFSFTPTQYDVRARTGVTAPSASETSTILLFRGSEYGTQGTSGPRLVKSNNYFYRGSVSYVTGGHAMKAGIIGNPGRVLFDIKGLSPDTPYEVRLLNGT